MMAKVIPFPGARRVTTPRVRLTPQCTSISAERDSVCFIVHGNDQTIELWMSPDEARALAEDLIERADDAEAYNAY